MAPAQQGPWLVLLDRLAVHLEAHKSDTSGGEDRKARNKKLVRILEDVCTVVRDAERKVAPEFAEVVENAHGVLNDALRYAYSQDGGFSNTISFAHSEDEPLVEDALEHAGSDILDAFFKVYTSLLKPGAPTPKLPAFVRIRPWTKSPRPHPLSTRLSRFRGGFAPSATPNTPLAHSIYQARAQLTVDSTIPSVPFDMSLSSGGNILATASGSGWKAREPALHYYLLGHQSSDFLEGVTMDPGLSDVANYIATDESRKLVFLADDHRVKSFSFAPAASGKVPKRLPNVHTMNSQCDCDGPLALLPNGRLARAGRGKVAIWTLDALETHQDSPGKLIGEGTLRLDGSSRGDTSEIERSTGSPPSSIVSLASDPAYFPAVWHLHEPSGHLLCGEHAEESGGYACMSVDLEHGGKRVARYLGHGGEVERFATSQGDPNVFLTAGSDGYARLFDVRRPLPVLTFNTGLQREACNDVVLVHPDGIPTLFTAGDITQQVKTWDIRAEECVYELSTGNNAVAGLAWDDTRSSLYVATECRYVNRMGVRTGYRRARIPRWATWAAVEKEYKAHKEAARNGVVQEEYGGNDYPDVYDAYSYLDEDGDGTDEESDDEADEDDVDEAYSADMRWPTKCFHKESFFGYAYDAGEHTLLRWHFKDTPDITQLPASTSAD
ncbi:hypothetical protein DICSQDRAFT_100114 [Dichomitus squalens LYAD-421 SS1]|uniref:uncharacterized protein n=1 Tax=Dichomitus squalens (strain LYAD-421) TaxID=732165 RepID=UPI0004414194|nr:uncharacterized protein DICSQDRAFT_100114 [Dichomitus squalens LYAD-421 SS1]EJF64781.1 hypothetical protein DICSQDRAFT_100114 [Dichomitus squalens LYAD-421 SS1]